MGDLTPGIVLGILFLGITAIVKILSDNKLRHKLIDKGLLNEKAQFLFPEKKACCGTANLKWGMILVAIGLAFLLPHVFANGSEELILAGLFLFVGIALLIFYMLGSKKDEAQRKK
jgi:hypothetical protein